jgi:hypothetical protein
MSHTCVRVLTATVLALGVSATMAGAAASNGPGGAGPRVARARQRSDIETKMRLSRADAAFAETREAADEMTRLAAEVATRVDQSGTLDKNDAKSLDRIKKLAKRIRFDLGGLGSAKLERPPRTAKGAAAALSTLSTEFGKRFSDASRYQTDARAIAILSEMIEVSEILKSLGER